ncbi:MAG TPA: CpsD/CapB family tyrosine-protein kinase [Vicinamibacterales bacterium]|nr:CpsD/CapB family tyrosine-protein kinase [Vicinamibacterales bacterium]
MIRLSDALKRAEAEATRTPVISHDAMPDAAPPPNWTFSPVETMHVPEEPPAAASDPRHGTDAPMLLVPPAPIGKPQFGDADRHKLIVGEGVEPATVEQYRQLAAVMHHAQKSSGVRSVMVTSALPAEGKTLTATNLALTLSESYQRRVLLIDADLRRPRMREMFALPATEGLTDSLAAVKDGRLPVHQVTPNLWVLTSGRVFPDPMSLLVSPAMKQLLDDAKDSFDWVVVDTPPIAILSDANLLASMIDTTLLVVSAQKTPYPMVQRAAQALGTNRILGVVLNRAEEASLSSSYGYYSYHPQPLQGRPAHRPRWLGWLRKGHVQ